MSSQCPAPNTHQKDAPIDGIVETCWESAEALERVKTSPELQAVIADEPNFMGHSNHYFHTLHVFETVELVNRIKPA